MRRIRFEDTQQWLDEALALCRSLGLGDLVERGRFAEHCKRLERLIWIIRQGPFAEMPEPLRKELEENQVEFVTALLEGLELSETLGHLRGTDLAQLPIWAAMDPMVPWGYHVIQ